MEPQETQLSPEGGLREQERRSRRNLLRGVGGAGMIAALATVVSACGDDDDAVKSGAATGTTTGAATSGDSDTAGDLEIVNYALTLEYLEADFYMQVIDSGVITDKKVANLAKEIGQHEQEHVDALKATVEKLGGTPAPVPTTNFEDVLAGGPDKILATAAVVENLGAAAYLGQAGRIKNKEILAAALAIHSVEARHAAALNSLIGAGFKGKGSLQGSIPDGAFASPLDMDAVLEQAKPFIA